MAVTTRKEFKLAVQNHVISCLSEDETNVLPEQLKNVVSEFNNNWNGYEKKRFPNRQDAFIDWLWKLPSSLSITYWNDGIEKEYNSWFIAAGVQPKELKTDVVNKWYTHFIFREFCTLCKKNGVEF